MAILLLLLLCFVVPLPMWFSLLMQTFNSSPILIPQISQILPLIFLLLFLLKKTHSSMNSIQIPSTISFRCRAYLSLIPPISISSLILLLLPQMGFKTSPISMSKAKIPIWVSPQIPPSINLSVSNLLLKMLLPPPSSSTNPCSSTEASVKNPASNLASNPF